MNERIDHTRYDATILNVPPNILPLELLDEILRDVIEYAGDDLEMSGVECLEECQSIMDVSPRETLFYVLFERDWESGEDARFLNLIHKLIEHAGTPDDDMLND